MSYVRLAAFLLLGGCCGGGGELDWDVIPDQNLDEGAVELALEDFVVGGAGELVFEVQADESALIAWVEDGQLSVASQPDWEGESEVTLSVSDRCDQASEVSFVVTAGVEEDVEDDEPTVADSCSVTFEYVAQAGPKAVALAGSFNAWSTNTHPMTVADGDNWSITVDLEPGPHAYKFVETGTDEFWACDPNAELIQCDEGYKSPDDTSWSHSCGPGVESCNSMLIVADCGLPTLVLDSLDIDVDAGAVSASVSVVEGQSESAIADARVTLDDVAVDGWTGSSFEVSLTGISAARHVLRFDVTDEAGRTAETLQIPFWLDGDDWKQGAMYYAFVDRFSNGDTSLDTSEGASAELGAYMGGDFQGVIDKLPYLDDLGVTALWLTNPQDNVSGAWDADCGTYSAYHGYWPVDRFGVEEHFGDEDSLRALVDAAHGYGMRVLMDWVGNHVHEDHPWYTEHGDQWFNEQVLCKVGDDYSNFDLIPETCWFAEYLPDIRFYELDPLHVVIEDAIEWAREYDLDGFRVDGAKHMPHSVQWNLAARIDQEFEHSAVGGSFDFYTIGETYTSSRDWILAYQDENQLDAQFDFPLFFSLVAAFADGTASLSDLGASVTASEQAYGDALMGTFLGNHDVVRWSTYLEEGWVDECAVAPVSEQASTYERLNLAWTFLFTQPGLPLVYYGDELGLPGYADPGNRQPLFWYLDESEAIDSVDAMADALLYPQQETVLRHVHALIDARKSHPSLSIGETTEWWIESEIWGYARVASGDEALVLLNLSEWDRTLENSLAFAGLSTEGTYEDVLTGETFEASSDFLSVDVPARSSRVLVLK